MSCYGCNGTGVLKYTKGGESPCVCRVCSECGVVHDTPLETLDIKENGSAYQPCPACDTPTVQPQDDPVIIDFETAEYLSILLGHTNWGNQARRGRAAEKLAAALGKRPLTNSIECFGKSRG
jgi:hypothetical protein